MLLTLQRFHSLEALRRTGVPRRGQRVQNRGALGEIWNSGSGPTFALQVTAVPPGLWRLLRERDYFSRWTPLIRQCFASFVVEDLVGQN